MKTKKNNEQDEKKAINVLKAKADLASKLKQPVAAKANQSSPSEKKPVITKTVKSSEAKATIKPKPVVSKTSSPQIRNDKKPVLINKTSNKDILVKNNKPLIKATEISSSKLVNRKIETVDSSIAIKKVVKIEEKNKNTEKMNKSQPTNKQNTATKSVAVSPKITNLKTTKSVETKVKPVLTKTVAKSTTLKPDKSVKSSNKPINKLPTATKTKPVVAMKSPPKPTGTKLTKSVTEKKPIIQIKSTKPVSKQNKNVKAETLKPAILVVDKTKTTTQKSTTKTDTKKPISKPADIKIKPNAKNIVNSISSKPVVKPLTQPKVVIKPSTKSTVKSENKPVAQAVKSSSVKPTTKPKTKEIVEKKLKSEQISNLKPVKPIETDNLKTGAKEKARAKSKPEVTDDLPYTDEQLSFYKQLLTKKREEFIQQVNGLRKKIKKALDQDNVYERNTGDPDSDYITESSEFAKDEILINRLEENIRDIEDALASIEDRSYGYCQKTGKLIEEERLKTIPWARYCIMIQNEIESSS